MWGTEKNGAEGTQGQPSTHIYHLATPQSPVCGFLECFPFDPVEEPDIHQQQFDIE